MLFLLLTSKPQIELLSYVLGKFYKIMTLTIISFLLQVNMALSDKVSTVWTFLQAFHIHHDSNLLMFLIPFSINQCLQVHME